MVHFMLFNEIEIDVEIFGSLEGWALIALSRYSFSLFKELKMIEIGGHFGALKQVFH